VSRLVATYHVRSDARAIESRARAIAIEQSVEMPLSGIEDRHILDDIVGRVEDIGEVVAGLFAVRIGLSRATVGDDAGQLINMLFGNTSLQDDVVLHDAELPDDVVARYGGPNIGLAGLRKRLAADGRALTCSALKPQGLSPARLAELAARFARGGIDTIKRPAARRSPRPCARSRTRPASTPVTSRASPATSMRCGFRSRPPRKPRSIP
jgi:ribulose-bisphosphate carboxylase large chain